MLIEAAPGIFAWQTKDMTRFRAYAVAWAGEVVLIDPVEPDAEEAAALAGLGKVGAIALTNAFHERASAKLAAHYGVPVYASREALAELKNKQAQPLPDLLPAGIEVLPAMHGLAGQVCFYVPRDGGSLLTGDAWHNEDLAALPLPVRLLLKHVVKLRQGLQPTPPSKCKDLAAFQAQLKAMLDRPVERMLTAHGENVTAGAGPRMVARLAEGP
ncbi:MAG: Metallo-beta-lactamase superfamily protein [Cyanobacteria bacterium RYN_339]|nr:Metallo-beta-lactamase superfamily protein [Cyanobacteria bacterium RYN_339]